MRRQGNFAHTQHLQPITSTEQPPWNDVETPPRLKQVKRSKLGRRKRKGYVIGDCLAVLAGMKLWISTTSIIAGPLEEREAVMGLRCQTGRIRHTGTESIWPSTRYTKRPAVHQDPVDRQRHIHGRGIPSQNSDDPWSSLEFLQNTAF